MVAGAMLSTDVDPETPGPYRTTLLAHATRCRDGEGEEWPIVGLYRDDERLDTVRISSTEQRRFDTKAFSLEGRATLRFVFLNDFSDGRCDRNVFVTSFDIARAE